MDKLKRAAAWILKHWLAVVALMLAGTTDAIGENVLNVPAWVGSLMISGAGLLGIAGVSPFPVSPAMARVLGILSGAAAALMVGHAAGQVWPPPAAHVALFHAIGIVGTVLGVIGGRQAARAMFASKPPLDQPPPEPPVA